MYILKCRRCGKEFIPMEGIDRSLIVAKVDSDPSILEAKVIDLCDECQMDLIAWWNYGIEKREKE